MRRQQRSGTRNRRPLYARVLRLRHLHLSGLLCFLFLEGMIALGVLLALAELVTWWAVLILPATVALMVKINDLVAGALATGGRRQSATPRGRAAVGPASVPPASVQPTSPAPPSPPTAWVARQVSRDPAAHLDPVSSSRQRVRQTARRRYG